MSDFIVDYEANRRAEALGLEILPASWGEGFDARMDEELARAPLRQLQQAVDRANAFFSEPYIDAETGVEVVKPVPLLSPTEANQQYGIAGHLVFDSETPEEVARELRQLKLEELMRQDTRRRSSAGWGADLAAGLLGSLRDPLSVGSAFIPFVGQARFAAMVARVGAPMARATTGAVEGFAGAALLEPLVYYGAQADQADYTAADSLMNLTFGTVMGGGLHLGAGFIGDRWAGRRVASDLARKVDDLPVEHRAAIIDTAVGQVESGRPVDIDPVLDAASALQERRAFQQPHEQRVAEFTASARAVGLEDPQIRALLPKDIRDSVTGFYRAEDRVPTLKRAMERIKETGEPAVYVEADVANLGGLNARFGHSVSNKIYSEMAAAFEDAIAEAGGTAVLFRHGGDEISAIVVNATGEQAKDALAGMRSRIDDIVSRHGAADIPHAKTPGGPPGTRLNYAVAEIREGLTVDDIFTTADLRVEALKKGAPDVDPSTAGTPGAVAPGARSGRITGGDSPAARSARGEGPRAAPGTRDSLTPEAVQAWAERQTEPYVDEATAKNIEAATARADRDAAASSDTQALIAETEAELADIGRLVSEEDMRLYDAAGEEEAISGAVIARMEQEMPVYERIYEQAATCLSGKR